MKILGVNPPPKPASKAMQAVCDIMADVAKNIADGFNRTFSKADRSYEHIQNSNQQPTGERDCLYCFADFTGSGQFCPKCVSRLFTPEKAIGRKPPQQSNDSQFPIFSMR